ncbi:hypothetical protein [Deinococcus altitudinis]|uniref:hypothetical protein n=1 Tax=Deinococcus altitudinis TaxID=468914 RepID=UPI0038928662
MLPVALRPLFLFAASLCAAATALTLSGCAPGLSAPTTRAAFSGDLTLRPAGSPDVLLLAVSGRCPTSCKAPEDNIDYLTPRGTVQAVQNTLEAQGLSVASYAVASNLDRHTVQRVVQAQIGAGRTVPADQNGFLQLEDRLNTAYADWMRGRSNPTRIVLLAHSHGVVWTHALTRAHPEVPISAMIDLDGVCDFWEMDNRRFIQAHLARVGRNPWGFNLADSCGSVRVGNLRYDLKDVVYPNVQADLEVQSVHLLGGGGSVIANAPYDGLQNIRTDGTRQGVQTYRSESETHSAVSSPNGKALAWVKARLTELSADWKPAPPPVPALPQP